ncbi:MAG: DUF2520 domain-containing protein [Gemmatimonadota bacterium]
MSEGIVIVGPGRMGLALGAALMRGGTVDWLIYQGRTQEPPPHPLFDAGDARYVLGPAPVPEGTSMLILAVPDDALAEVAHTMARAGDAPAGCSAFHLSGALSTDLLGPLHEAGYAVGSVHPLQTIADAWSGADRLAGASVAIAGEPSALATARRLVNAIGGRAIVVPPTLRPLYHAAAVFASNYLVAVTGLAVEMFRQAGVPEPDAVAAILPLMRGTMKNLEDLGLSASLTGPVARGDVDTVRLHLSRLSGTERTLYCALGLVTLRLARAAGLDEERAADLESLLSTG